MMSDNKTLCQVSISGDGRYRALNHLIRKGSEIERTIDKNEQLIIYTHRSNKKAIISACKDYKCETSFSDSPSKKHMLIRDLFLHSGVVVGLLISVILGGIFSQMILRINIENDDPQVKADIMSVLDENDLRIGSFKGRFDYVKLERELKGKVNGISWAGISVQGSTLTVDTIDNIPKPETDNRRLPCNVVALHDCVLEKAEVYCGDLKAKIGSGVRAGDIIISGERKKTVSTGKDNKETEVTQYMRASGKVFGTFEKRAEFFFPYEQTVNTPTGKTENVSYLNIFDTDIPLFIKNIDGTYTYKTQRKPLEIFGFELPIAVTDVEYSEYTEAVNTYTDEDIMGQIEKSISTFEKDFLTEYEIRDLKKSIIKSDKGVTLTLEYTLYGEIGEQVDIYLNKE